jgi:hypothetical protein
MTLATETVKPDDKEICSRLRQEYMPRLMPKGRVVTNFASVALDVQGKVAYHKDILKPL